MPTEIAPWIERFRLHRLAIGTAALVLALTIALVWVAWRWGIAEDRMAMLQQQAEAGFLQAPSSSRIVHIDPRAPRPIAVSRGDFPERIDLRFNARTNRHARFRMSLVRNDGTLLVHADQVVRDSNYDLRLSFNTSILPAGGYLVTVEGYARAGQLEPFAEVPIRVSGP